MAARTHSKNNSVPRRYSLAERLEHYSIPEPNSGCLLWTGPVDMDRYGRLMFNRRFEKAHRWAWEHHYGPIPIGLFVCHKCDNRLCINPNHLFVGSALDNNQDRSRKNRNAHNAGEKCGRAKLTTQQVLNIRTAEGTLKQIASLYGVSMMCISNIRRGKTWRHVLLAAALTTTACSSKPVQIAADTACVRFRHIDVTEWQVADMKRDPNQWRPLAVQIKSHNDEYQKACM